jgi:hypothetical protein
VRHTRAVCKAGRGPPPRTHAQRHALSMAPCVRTIRRWNAALQRARMAPSRHLTTVDALCGRACMPSVVRPDTPAALQLHRPMLCIAPSRSLYHSD